MKDAVREAIKELLIPEINEIKASVHRLEGVEELSSRFGDVNFRLESVNTQLIELSKSVNAQLLELNKGFNAQLIELNRRIDDTNKRIDEVREELTQRIDELNRRIDSREDNSGHP